MKPALRSAPVIVLIVVTLFGAVFGLLLFTSSRVPESPHAKLFQFDSLLGWVPTAKQSLTVTGSRAFHVNSNARGFRDTDHDSSLKPRLLFIGDSFVWGYDVDNAEMFTEKLRGLLPEWDIWNEGVSAYGSDQSLLLLKQTATAVKPSAVVFVFCTENDRHDNRSSQHGEYEKPFFTLHAKQLELNNSPLAAFGPWLQKRLPILLRVHRQRATRVAQHGPDPTEAIVLEMARFTQSLPAKFSVALTAPDPALQAVLTKANIPSIVLENIGRYQGNGDHWSAQGHYAVAQRLATFLRKDSPTAAPAQTVLDTRQ